MLDLPTVWSVERLYHVRMLNTTQLVALERSLRDRRVLSVSLDGTAKDPASKRMWRVRLDHGLSDLRDWLADSPHAERDELAGMMLVQLLHSPAFDAQNASRTLMTGELIDLAQTTAVDAVCISVVAPTTIVHARHLCAKLRARLPHVEIVVGLWGATENVTEAAQRLRTSGADEIVVSLAEAVTQLLKRSAG